MDIAIIVLVNSIAPSPFNQLTETLVWNTSMSCKQMSTPARATRLSGLFPLQAIRRRITATMAKMMPDAKAIEAPEGRLP